MSHPYMLLYVADYLSDTAHLNCEESGAYMALIMHYWRTGGLPDDDERLARIVKLPLMRWQCVRIALVPLFASEWRHKRIDKELAKASEKSAKAKISATKRWKHKRKLDDALAMRTQCVGNANAESLSPANEPLKYKGKLDDALAMRTQCVGNAMRSSIKEEKKERKEGRLIDTNVSIVNEPENGPVDAHGAEKQKALREALKSFGEQWNELACAFRLPTIDEIKSGSTRERQALARLREDPECPQKLIARVRGSPYLRGEVNGFHCGFDWIIKPSNFQKIMEGNYEDRKRVK